MIKGTIAIVGRPNVGKSSLFNCLTRKRHSITHETPGVTRDLIYSTVFYDSSMEDGFNIIDTGGYEDKGNDTQPFKDNIILEGIEKAISLADMILFMVDAKAGVISHDRELYSLLLKSNKPFIPVVNKIDGKEQIDRADQFYELGIDTFVPIGAKGNYNTNHLIKVIYEKIESLNLKPIDKARESLDKQDSRSFRLSIVGKPNAGKSSLLNRILGEQRALVSEIPGTTRDSINATIKCDGHIIEIVDTAGIRKRTKINEKVEAYSVSRSIENIENSDVCILMMDAEIGLTDQDAKIIKLILKNNTPFAIVVNKWDTVPNKESTTINRYKENIYRRIGSINYIPILFVSCLTNQRIPNIMQMAINLYKQSHKRVATNKVNTALKSIVTEYHPQVIKKYNKKIKFYYATQIDVSPPTIAIITNVPSELSAPYKKYMEKKFRSLLGFTQVPIVMKFKDRGNKKRQEEDLLSSGRANQAQP